MAPSDLESSSAGEELVFISDDDSDDDPTFNILEETLRSSVSNISIKKSGSCGDDDDDEEDSLDPMEADTANAIPPKLSKEDEKCFETVESLIKDGQLNKLKVDQCKIYLRKYGLRLTGNKEVLVGRIKEHLNIVDGGGEKMYPPSSFVLNCKGDACTGDVVMFEQNVYEMFSIVSRSATAPSCGTRIVAGRIVKESYGAAKQQHTFTIEVLWSKGEKPWPPLHPLLIKGRNLYRLKTLRQRWANEAERRKVLQEKHSRGSLARSSRENRILEKEARKIARAKRTTEKNTEQKILSDHVNKQKANQRNTSHVLQQAAPHQHEIENQPNPLRTDTRQQYVLQPQQKTNHVLQQVPRQHELQNQPNSLRMDIHQQHFLQHQHLIHQHHIQQPHGLQYQLNPFQPNQYVRPQFPVTLPQYQQACASATLWYHQRRPLSSLNSLLVPPPQHQIQCQRQPCRFFREGKCRFGDDCKHVHDCVRR